MIKDSYFDAIVWKVKVEKKNTYAVEGQSRADVTHDEHELDAVMVDHD